MPFRNWRSVRVVLVDRHRDASHQKCALIRAGILPYVSGAFGPRETETLRQKLARLPPIAYAKQGASAMTIENNPEALPTNAQAQQPSWAPVTPASPQKKEDSATQELAREFRTVEIIQIVISGALAIIGVAALYIYGGQLKEMQRSTDATIANFKRDERAWMAFKFMEGNLTFTIGKSFLVPTQIVNTGKTPARDVRGKIVVGVLKNGERLGLDYSPGHAHYQVFAGTIFPTGHIEQSFEGIQHGIPNAESIILNKPMWEEILSGKSLVVVHGRIEYKDIFGTDHWTTYCRYVLHPELISEECTRYNDTDDNK